MDKKTGSKSRSDARPEWLMDILPDLDRALTLAFIARAFAAIGDQEVAKALRDQHDAIFAEIEKRLSNS